MKEFGFTEKKKNGITFTPEPLALFLAEKILEHYNPNENNELIITDPACGDGALLSSIARQLPASKLLFYGYDTNESFLNKAKSWFKNKGITKAEFVCADFLQLSNHNQDLFSSVLEPIPLSDIIIANPPYVRTQVLGAERSQELAKSYSLSGKVDLYFAFIVAMTRALKTGGILGVITSNRYMTTKSGAPIRKYLIEQYDLLEVIDLGDTHLFDAAVLPAIFIGRKKTKKSSNTPACIYRKIYEKPFTALPVDNQFNSVFEILKQKEPSTFRVKDKYYEYGIGLLKHDNGPSGIWQMTSESENQWIKQVESCMAFRIKDKFKVRVGIKSCADNVFLNPDYDIESQLIRKLISQENISQWVINQDSCINVLYPHYSINGKRMTYDIDMYPKAKAYLEKYKSQLEGREYLINAGRKWYEMWVPQNPALFDLPKVVFPDISMNPRFTFDSSGAIVNGNCYWIVAHTKEEEALLLLIEGVSNSNLMTKYHDLRFNNKLYSGRRRYLSQYIENYPMPDPNTSSARNIIEIVKHLNASSDIIKQKQLKAELEACVLEAFNMAF